MPAAMEFVKDLEYSAIVIEIASSVDGAERSL
jgi:hypothetical protein